MVILNLKDGVMQGLDNECVELKLNKSTADKMISLQKEIKVEIFNIQSEIGGVRGEILLIRSDIAKIDILKWSIVIIITVISLIFLLITV
jgi:hypothetical protein